MDNKKIIGLSLISIAVVGVYFYLKNKSEISAESKIIETLKNTQKPFDSFLKTDSVNEKLVEEKTLEEKEAIALASTLKKLDEIAPKLKRSAVFAKQYQSILTPLGIKVSVGINKSGVTIFPKHEDVIKIMTNKINQKGYNLLANYEVEKKTK